MVFYRDRIKTLTSFRECDSTDAGSLHASPLHYPIRKSVVAAVRPQIPYLEETLKLLVTYNCTCTSDTAAGPIELPASLAAYEPPVLEMDDLPTPQRKWQLVKHRKMARQ